MTQKTRPAPPATESAPEGGTQSLENEDNANNPWPAQAREALEKTLEEVPALGEQLRQLASLQGELEAARARIDTLARAYQEVERDKEDFKRRLGRERERLLELEKGKMALLLIEAIDELELCLKNADASALSVGVRMIRDNLLKKLKENEVVALELEGTLFNPNFAEAVDLQGVDNPEDNMKILEVLRPGYAFKEQVIRPARVRVARYLVP